MLPPCLCDGPPLSAQQEAPQETVEGLYKDLTDFIPVHGNLFARYMRAAFMDAGDFSRARHYYGRSLPAIIKNQPFYVRWAEKLGFLRRTEWARKKVEGLYLRDLRERHGRDRDRS